MSRLVVELPRDRDRCGRIELLSDKGKRVCGPFPIAGRSSSMLAAAHQNPTRFPLLPYGDTPVGNYLVRSRIRSGKATGLPKQEFGPAGALVLEGITGDAALADANGRFRFFVQGGNLSPEGWLRSTAGGLRMANDDLRLLLAALAKTECRSCEIIESDFVSRDPVFDDDECELPDPIPSSLLGQSARESHAGLRLPSRGKVLMVMGASFVVQSQVNAEPVREAIVSPPKIPGPRAIHWVPMAAATAAQPTQAYNPPATPPTSSVTPSPSPTLEQIQNGGNTGVIFENSRGQGGSDVNVHPQTNVPEVSGSPVQGGGETPPVQPPPTIQSQPQSSSSGDAAYQHYLEKQQRQQQQYNQRANQVIEQINQQQATPPAAVTTPPPPAPPPAPPTEKKKKEDYKVVPPPPKPERGR